MFELASMLINSHNHILVIIIIAMWLQPSYPEIASFTKMTVPERYERTTRKRCNSLHMHLKWSLFHFQLLNSCMYSTSRNSIPIITLAHLCCQERALDCSEGSAWQIAPLSCRSFVPPQGDGSSTERLW